jgi:hypothetical protein
MTAPRTSEHRYWAVLLALLAFGLTGRAHAQVTAGRIVVLPVTGHGDGLAKEQHGADLVEAALATRGAPLVSMHDARDRLEATSRPPAVPDSADPDVLAREARAAVEHVAFGRSAAAQRSVEEVFRRAERALESLNRETKNARNVLDACLALVRSHLDGGGQRQDALDQAMRCRRMVPDVSPSEFTHPARVVGVLAEADNQLRRMRIGRLTVESAPKAGCAVYLNGRHLGVTPFRLDRAAEGEYRIQVECSSAPERVHIVRLGEAPVQLHVDTQLDHALRSQGRIALVYATLADVTKLAVQHAAEVALSVRAEEAVLVSIVAGYVQLVRLSADGATLLGRTRVAVPQNEDVPTPALAGALDALFEGRIEPEPATNGEGVSRTSAKDSEFSSLGAPAASTTGRSWRTRRLRIVAGSLGAMGIGLWTTGMVFERRRKDADDRLESFDNLEDPEMAEASKLAQEDYDRAARLRWLGLGGGGLLTAAVPLLRVDVSRGVPWWSYALGGVGAALATWGVLELVRDGECEAQLTGGGCSHARESAGKGGLLLAGAAPLLALPLDHLLEWRLGIRRAHTQARLLLSHDRVLVSVGGMFPR